MEYRPEVVGLGLATADLLVGVPRLPGPDEVFAVDALELQGGGPVATALAALGLWGVATTYLGPIANDRWGGEIAQGLQQMGVSIQHTLPCPGAQSSFSVLLVQATTGQRSILYRPGQGLDYPPEAVPLEVVQQARILHLDGSYPQAALVAAQAARQAGVTVSFDGGAGERIWPGTHELLPWIDLLIVAQRFAHNLTGQSDPLVAGPLLLEYGAKLAIITDGANGCWYFSADEQLFQPAFPVKVVDTTGAGDTFHGAYLYAHLQGWSVQRSLVFASAAAGLKCQGMGGRLSLPRLEQVLTYCQPHWPLA